MQIKFGTDGWRAIIARDYTIANLLRVSEATAAYMAQQNMRTVVIGYDCRFGGEMFAREAATLLADRGIKVYLGSGFASTPMVSLANVKLPADLGIVITASHNPPSYNGFKLKSSYGGPCIPSEIAAVESLIPDHADSITTTFEEALASGRIEYIDLEQMYMDHVEANFDLEAIRQSNIHLAYDAMFGAGQNVIKRLFPDVAALHCSFNPSFLGQAPEPIARNLTELSNLIKHDPTINLGLANDGDADRIGMFDENGEFIDSHHILMLLLYYLYEFKGMKGDVVVTYSVTNKMKQLADLYGLDTEITKIGFKYIAEIQREREVLVGGEESGGLAVLGHIPERDGIWIGLLIMEFMAKTGKSLKQLIQDLYDKVGSFAFDRYDLHITEELKQSVIKACHQGEVGDFGKYKAIEVNNLDGFKFYFDDNSWSLIRPSGTEPVLRVYAQAPTHEEVIDILESIKAKIMQGMS